MTLAGVVLGCLLVGYGVGLIVDAIVDWRNKAGWTASLGGVVFGVGLALLVVSSVARQHRVHLPACALIVIGCVLAGYSLGGGIDNVLRRINGEDYSGAFAGLALGLGVGVVFVGIARAKMTPRHENA